METLPLGESFGSATTDAKQVGKASWERQKKIDYHYDPRPMPDRAFLLLGYFYI